MFESFNDFVNNEARDFNDPLLIKMRAAQMQANKKAAEKAEKAKKELSPAKLKKIQALKDERAEVLKDMEQEGELEGGEIADMYGDMLNNIDKQIIKLGGNPLEESYDGNMADFKYEFPNKFEDVTGNPVKAIKKISKKGKGFEVRTSTYMSRPEMEEVGDAMGLIVTDYQKHSNIAITVYESVVTEGYGEFIKAKNLTDIVNLSKEKKRAVFYVTDDNNSRIGAFYLKNGKFAKATSANPSYDLQNNKTSLKDRSDVIYKYKIDESVVTEGNQLKKGDIVKFKDGSSIYIVGPKGDGYDYKDGREKGHHPKGWFDMMISSGKAIVESVVNEGKVQLKRRYTENHPAITVGKTARVRNKMLEAIADGKITQEEFDAILKEFSSDSKRWMQNNTKYFSVSEDGISLSTFGKRALGQITVNEDMENNKPFMFESFSDFSKSNKEELNEGYVKSRGYKLAEERIETLLSQLDPNSNLCKGISKAADNVVPEFKEMKKHMNEIASIWQDIEYTIEMSNESVVTEEVLCEATVEMDAMDPDNKDFLKFLKKNRVKIISKEMDGPGGGTPVITMQGKRKDLENVLADGEYGWDDADLAEYIEESVVNESRVLLDTTEPDNKHLLRFIKKHKITMKDTGVGAGGDFAEYEYTGKRKDLEDMISTFWGDDDLAEYIEESVVNEGLHPKLKKAQKAIEKGETVYGENVRFPGRFKILELGNMFAKVDYEDGTEPMEMAAMNIKVDSLQFESVVTDSNEAINEAFKSSKLRNLLNMDQSGSDRYGQKASKLAQGLYGISKIKLDEVEDADLIDLTPEAARKEASRSNDFIVFYIIDNEKENPYADKNSYRTPTLRPGILAVTRGKDFLGVTYDQRASRPSNDKRGQKRAYGMDPDKDGVGGNKNYRGYDASGIYNVKRAADLADRAIVFDMTMADKSAKELIQQRADAQSGAIAFKSDVDFKKANMTRYREILATKASKLPLDKMVEKAINDLSAQIKDGLANGEFTRYGDILIGKNKRGSEVKMRDASNHMSNILDAYGKYVSYTQESQKEKDNGYSSKFYEKEAKAYAKRVTDDIKKIESFDYAW